MLTVFPMVAHCVFCKEGTYEKNFDTGTGALLGVVSFLSYTTAVVFAPLAYPGYNWMSQAVSDLSAANAPSLALWNQLSAFYNVCEVVCVTVVCIGMTFRNFYYLKQELVDFCRENALPVSGGKIELTDRIACFLDTGKVLLGK